MSAACKCDRCGRYYERGTDHESVTIEVHGGMFRGSDISFTFLAWEKDSTNGWLQQVKRSENVDLCPDCLREFYEWFVGGQPEPHSVPGVCESTFD